MGGIWDLDSFGTAIFEWLKQCEDFQALYWIKGDFEQEEINGQVVCTPQIIGENEQWVRRYRGNKGIKQYPIRVLNFRKMSGMPYNTANEEQTKQAIKIQKWVKEQNKVKNYPSLPYEVTDISVTGITIARQDKNNESILSFFVYVNYFYRE